MDLSNLSQLKQALPYIQKFKGKIFVVKMSGKVIEKVEVLRSICEEIALLNQVGFKILVVHGGGKQVNELAASLGVEQTVIAGRRVTDKSTLEITKMVFGGLINTNITSALRRVHIRTVGLSGLDGNIITAVKREPKTIKSSESKSVEVDFGFVGDVVAVDTKLIDLLLTEGYVPVLSSLGSGANGEVYNINADTIASELAKSLKAEKIIFLTDVRGIYSDVNNSDSKIPFLDDLSAQHLIDSGVIKEGMIPKITSILQLLKFGVGSAHIVSAQEESVLLREVFTDEGAGTMVTLARK